MDTKYFSEDTIVASATGLSTKSAIAILRVSGSDCLKSANKYLRLRSTRAREALDSGNTELIKPRFLYRAEVLGKENRVIDDGLVCFFKGPNSYTGEDLIEVHLHGNPLIQRELMDTIISSSGARPAEPGEFSFRSLRNGKMDLSQVEAVDSLISAETVRGAELAVHSLSGTVRRFVDPIQDEIRDLLASLELELDFSDQDVEVLDWQSFSSKLDGVIHKLNRAIQDYDSIRPVVNGVSVSFVGRPNAGKSTLFNALLGEDRSIVTEIKGTTRDIVREQIYLDGLLLKLADTAGLRETDDIVEAEGIRRSFSEIESSELVLLLIDGGELSSDAGFEFSRVLLENVREATIKGSLVTIINKMDISEKASVDRFVKECLDGLPVAKVSAAMNEGVRDLVELIKDQFATKDLMQKNPEIFCERQRIELSQALSILNSVQEKVSGGVNELDLLSTDLRTAMTHIAEISGSADSEMILNHIFSSFCIGK